MEKFVYCFMYNSCFYESSDVLISINRTYKGAYLNMRGFLMDKYEEWKETPKKYRKHILPIENYERYYIKREKVR